MKKIYFISMILVLVFAGCKNQDWEFPDYETQSVYFAYQFPIRTVTFGEDVFDTTLDNEGKVKVMATTGGVYDTKKDVTIDFIVDNSMTQDLVFSPGNDILPLPSSYYTLASNKIILPKGSLIGGVEVQLTDAFFADPKSIETTYVLPLRMTGVTNADSILVGEASIPNPRKGVAGDWDVTPKDFVFYAIKYINTWHGNYLRRGQDVIVGKNGNTALNQTLVRRNQYVEKDEVKEMNTLSMTDVELPLTFKDVDGNNINFSLILKFDNSGKCTISSATNGITASGSGSFVKRGDKNSWGDTDRDVVYLNYEIDMPEMQISTSDTLVMRDRGVKMETFSPSLK